MPVKCELRKSNTRMIKEQGKEDHTGTFILVNSSLRATSSPLHNNAKNSLKTTSFYIQLHYQDSILNPTRLILPLCWTLPHKMHHPSAKCRTLLQCNMQTYNKNEIPINYNTIYTQTPYSSIYLPKNM